MEKYYKVHINDIREFLNTLTWSESVNKEDYISTYTKIAETNTYKSIYITFDRISGFMKYKPSSKIWLDNNGYDYQGEYINIKKQRKLKINKINKKL